MWVFFTVDKYYNNGKSTVTRIFFTFSVHTKKHALKVATFNVLNFFKTALKLQTKT